MSDPRYGPTIDQIRAEDTRRFREGLDAGAAASAGADRCDEIVNNGMGEPTECGRTLPCEYHDPDRFGARTDEAAIEASMSADFRVLAMMDQPILGVDEDGDHDHTGIPCRTCVVLGVPKPWASAGADPEMASFLEEARPGPWVAEKDHVVWLRNAEGDSLMVNASDVARLVNSAVRGAPDTERVPPTDEEPPGDEGMTFYQVKDGRIIRELPADRMAVEMTADGVQYVYHERPHPGDVLEMVGHWLHHDPDCAWHRSDPKGCDCGLARAEWRLLHPDDPR